MPPNPDWPTSPLVPPFLERVGALSAQELAPVVARWVALRDMTPPVWAEATAALDAVHDGMDELARGGAHDFCTAAVDRAIAGEDWFPTARHVCATAVLALLARNALRPQHFATLYHPFSDVIPLAELRRGGERRPT